MPASQDTLYSPEDATSTGQDIFEVVVEDWGTDSTDRWPLGAAGGMVTADQRGFPFTPAAVVLGPRSTVDRVWLSWNTFKKWPLGSGFQQFLYRTLSVDNPIVYSLPAGNGVLNSALVGDTPIGAAFTQGLIYFFPGMSPTDPDFPVGSGLVQSTFLPATYIKADGTVGTFGSNPLGTALFDTPVLHLQFVTNKAVPQLPTKRFPYQARSSGGNTTIGNLQDEYAVAFIPTFGRSKITVQMDGSEAGMVFRVGALRALNNSVAAGFLCHETTEGEKTAAAANESVKFQFCDICADYIVLYATSAAVNLGTTTNFTVTAYD